jgi:hypothetical protein
MKITDSVTVTNTILSPPKRSLLVGGSVGGNKTSAALRVSLGFRTKKQTDFIYSYDVINAQHNVGFIIPIGK